MPAVLLALDAFADELMTVEERLPRRECQISTLPTVTRRAITTTLVASSRVSLPGGIMIDAPKRGSMLTIPMDAGYAVHVERSALRDETAVTVEAPPDVIAPVTDEELAELVDACRGRSEDSPAGRTLRDAWQYRCAFARLTEAFPADVEVGPIRWLTLSFRNHVRLPGLGSVDVTRDLMGKIIEASSVSSRRIGTRDKIAPLGAVELVVVR